MLITFEGGEGSGKGTQVKKLKSFLEEKGLKVVLAREPGGEPIAEEIRTIIQRPREEKMNSYTELLLFQAARSQFVGSWLKQAIEENDVVILDRFYDSTTAYQGYGRGLDLKVIKEMNEFAAMNIVPDVTFILDVDPEAGLKRTSKSEFGEKDRIEQESLEFHKKVRQGYLELAKDERFVVIDANKSLEHVFNEIKNKMNSLL